MANRKPITPPAITAAPRKMTTCQKNIWFKISSHIQEHIIFKCFNKNLQIQIKLLKMSVKCDRQQLFVSL